MKNKGFTLIELLAVIVILAIIALIATPIILNIINDARESAKERSAELVVANVKSAYSVAYAKTYPGKPAGDVPTLAQVAGEIGMQNAEINANGSMYTVETSDGVFCDISKEDGYLYVECRDKEDKDAQNLKTYTGDAAKIATADKMALGQ